jgi:hypothetical protein
MENRESLNHFCHQNTQTILADGAPWAKFILLSADDPQREHVKRLLFEHPHIKTMIQKMEDEIAGLDVTAPKPPNFRVYGSYYWRLRFLADIGLSSEQSGLDFIFDYLKLCQLEDGQFMIRYHQKKHRAISLVCVTAHLTYCLIRLGYQDTAVVRAALNHLLTTQRSDGGWHCDRLKQPGERDQFSVSCPAANMQAILTLGQFGKKFDGVIKPAIDQCLHFLKRFSSEIGIYDSECQFAFDKLRYPPHYTGLDLLNVIYSLSFFSHLINRSELDNFIELVFKRWNGVNWLSAEKTILEWANFDFSRNGRWSDWITSLFITALRRMNIVA